MIKALIAYSKFKFKVFEGGATVFVRNQSRKLWTDYSRSVLHAKNVAVSVLGSSFASIALLQYCQTLLTTIHLHSFYYWRTRKNFRIKWSLRDECDFVYLSSTVDTFCTKRCKASDIRIFLPFPTYKPLFPKCFLGSRLFVPETWWTSSTKYSVKCFPKILESEYTNTRTHYISSIVIKLREYRARSIFLSRLEFDGSSCWDLIVGSTDMFSTSSISCWSVSY